VAVWVEVFDDVGVNELVGVKEKVPVEVPLGVPLAVKVVVGV